MPSLTRAASSGTIVTPSVAWSSTPSPSPLAKRSCTSQEFVASLSKNQFCGHAAATGLYLAAQQQLEHMKREYLHGKPATKKSVPMRERLANPNASGTSKMRKLTYDTSAGNAGGLLFRLVLEHVDTKGFLRRCGTHIPKAARDPLKFHSNFSNEFFGSCRLSWEQMSPSQQHDHLKSFLFKKWTTDVKGEAMLPARSNQWRRCEASWGDFSLSDSELADLCHDVMEAYTAQYPLLRQASAQR